MKFSKKIIIFLLFLFITAFIAAFIIFLTPNISQEYNLFIDEEGTYESIKADLNEKSIIQSSLTFSLAAKILNYEGENIRTGKFILKPSMTNFSIIRKLRSGRQDPVRVVIQNGRYLTDFISQLSSQLMIDSIEISDYLSHPDFLRDNNITKEETMTLFIPNTYEFYWNSSAETFRDRMKTEYERFWNESRTQKAKALNLTKNQVIALAAIVQKETAKVDERPRVAGVYLNRLKTGMLLQADPTVIYAIKRQSGDYTQIIKRVLYADLELDSPFNTYKYPGIPPGPIAMPDISSIDAVLNPENHDYYYFVADVTNFGYHKFAKTLAQHNVNKAEYVRWVNSQGLNR